MRTAALTLVLVACACASDPLPPARSREAPIEAPVLPSAPERAASDRPAEPPPLAETRVRWPTPSGEIDVVLLGEGTLGLVVLHGYGALPDDMVPLGRELARAVPLRIAVPTSSRTWRFGGPGRAWFEREATDADHQIERARDEVNAVADGLLREGRAEVLVLGFSQGASLALETALDAGERGRPLRGLAVLSARELLRFRGRFDALAGLDVFVSHGRADALIPFVNGEHIAALAEAAGARTTFVPFEGDHEIPAEVRSALIPFLSRLSN